MKVEKRSSQLTLEQLKQLQKKLEEQMKSFKDMNNEKLKSNLPQALEISDKLDKVKKLIQQIEKGESEDMATQNKIVNQENNAEVRSLMAGTGEGSKFVETKIYQEVIKKIKENGGLLADIKTFEGTGNLEVIAESATTEAEILEEGETLTPTDGNFNKIKFDTKRVGSAIKITKKLLASTDIDLIAYFGDKLSRRIENAVSADVCKNTKNKFVNIFVGTKIQTATTDLTIADIQNLIFSLKSQYKPNLYCNRTVLKQMATLIDGNGVPFLKKNGEYYEILGTKVKVLENAPDKKILAMDPVQAIGIYYNKNMEFNSISNDSASLLEGTVLSVADLYADVKVLDNDGLMVLEVKAA
ncbi:phage major capsid protein [Paraclostridium sordellii]|uniref:phage major capsid protein n=1 Tax=Paraclostridium sordellii TaxID=1505 RepID=UPI0005DB4CB8|nr:phage major capsid protein [Paeniclostridium sordellii]CEN26275.1 phage major capsid protein [[Clostridium] sordellii] [Paeniclostridium sordellii]